MSKWNGKVYRVENRDFEIPNDEWECLRDEVIRRDKYRCIRCDGQFDMMSLTVHHMIPRANGGGNNIENLISLCSECHDFVELKGLHTRADIIGSMTDSVRYETRGHQPSDWHCWVYGGMKSLKRGKNYENSPSTPRSVRRQKTAGS